MNRPLSLVMLVAWVCLPLSPVFGQGSGTRGGQAAGMVNRELPPLSPEVAKSYITIDGRAELRVRPTEIRVVLAVTSEAETAEKCQENVGATIERLKAAWTKTGIAPENIVLDFIAVLPRYSWSMEKREGTEVGVEKRIGYRMQTNVHLAVRNESQANAALAQAFAQGVTDIIAFDYWSKELDESKGKAREQALKAARDKADALLGTLFPDKPPVINVQEQTVVHYPESLYHTVADSAEETVRRDYRTNIPFIQAYRPRNTYYRGLLGDGDVQPRELPMNPEISVVSTVRLYFKSPAAKPAKTKDSGAKGKRPKRA